MLTLLSALGATLIAFGSVAVIAAAWRKFGPLAAEARRSWLETPATREVRFAIRAVQFDPRPGRVVALPVRARVLPQSADWRAAA